MSGLRGLGRDITTASARLTLPLRARALAAASARSPRKAHSFLLMLLLVERGRHGQWNEEASPLSFLPRHLFFFF